MYIWQIKKVFWKEIVHPHGKRLEQMFQQMYSFYASFLFKSQNEYIIHHYVQRNSGYQYITMHVTDKTLFVMTTASKAQAEPTPWHKCAQLHIH